MLEDRAVLEMSVDGTTGEFHLMGAAPSEELDRRFLVGNRGQSIRETVDILGGDADGGQKGYFLDAGQGEDTITLSFEAGFDAGEYNGVETQWGDGSSGIDKWDATGADKLTMLQTLSWWARNARTDSFRSEARLHWGQYTDGSINGETGFFDEPVTVVVRSVRSELNDERPSSFDGTIELVRAATIEALVGGNDNNPTNIPDR